MESVFAWLALAFPFLVMGLLYRAKKHEEHVVQRSKVREHADWS